MPKEHPFLGEHSSCATASKNAKNKSNRMTLLAMRDTKDTDHCSGRASRCSSEKDSGYSDGQQTDVEDQRSNKSECGGGGRPETAQSGQNKVLRRGDPGKPPPMPADRELPPIYIINNIVINQPERDPPPQGSGGRDNGHMILLQPPGAPPPAAGRPREPSSRSADVPGENLNGTYLPILNSYPRIAPHPGKKPPDKPSSGDESQNLRKRACTEAENTAATTSSSPTADRPSPSGSALHAASSSSALKPRGLHRNGSTGTRQHRFLNTVEILRQSGLLDITLRTKELLRQSNATERDIAQLRQHTELLCQAASDPGRSRSDNAAWERVYRAMAESGSYPDIKIPQNVPIAPHPDCVDAGGPRGAESSVSSSRRLTAVPDSDSGGGLQARDQPPEKDTFTPPDSSTD
ncbi:CLOCK-interacting pacemaker [Liparis tanakae]|uniref:CLOCK-interacting pacemaker n=1 Tax=Liparis tanakae TaxID=230148 RepID=A0A4Z2H2Y0_9TELE|nr:CLOCK-interacting pacemaker [Liparis tanakae]